jgi:hypothetical protein
VRNWINDIDTSLSSYHIAPNGWRRWKQTLSLKLGKENYLCVTRQAVYV